jgi:hypothetical protein
MHMYTIGILTRAGQHESYLPNYHVHMVLIIQISAVLREISRAHLQSPGPTEMPRSNMHLTLRQSSAHKNAD